MAFHAARNWGFSGRPMVVGRLGSRGSQGRASKSSSFSPGPTTLGGWEWLSMALILLISASNCGSGDWARATPPRESNNSEIKILLTIIPHKSVLVETLSGKIKPEGY